MLLYALWLCTLTYPQYHMIIDGIWTYLYGQLQYALKFELPSFGQRIAEQCILVFIRPCSNTHSADATQTRVYYNSLGPVIVADLTSLVSGAGRVPMGDSRFGIVDRSIEEAWPTVYEDFPDQPARNVEQ